MLEVVTLPQLVKFMTCSKVLMMPGSLFVKAKRDLEMLPPTHTSDLADTLSVLLTAKTLKWLETKNWLLQEVLTLKAPILTAADDQFCDIFPNFRQK